MPTEEVKKVQRLRMTWPWAAVCVAMIASFCGTASSAEPAYPTRPIRLIVASSPGGPNDLLARIVATPWGEALGRTIVVDNRAGAAGMIATEIAARAAPDGYTLLVGFPGPLIIGPGMSASPPYDALKDFTPISLMASGPFVLLANPNVPAKTMRDLVALAKSQPGKLNYGSGGAGQSSHMAMELFKLVAGIDMVHVPYKGAGPGMTALIAGEVAVMFASIGSAVPHVNSGKLRAVAVGGARRSPALPNVPTIKESGFAFDAASWYGIVAPRNLPQPIVQRLHSTLTAILNAPAMQSRLTDLGFEVNASTPAEFAEHLRSETTVWSKVIAATGMRTGK
jgi:tripartite-type tricarboxylate transporter receptor subunit TctC